MPSNDSEALLINARLECDDRTALNADACRLQCNSFRLLTQCVVFVRLTKLMLVSLLPPPPPLQPASRCCFCSLGRVGPSVILSVRGSVRLNGLTYFKLSTSNFKVGN